MAFSFASISAARRLPSTLEPMACALCRVDVPLRNSHIIPEFLYETLYDGKHRFHRLSVSSSQKYRMLQKGLREPLLCDGCEQHLSVFEGYARSALTDISQVDWTTNGDLLFLTGLDYAEFKLFQLSILWRAGVASLPEFRQVSLGPHEPLLRSMLLASDPGSSETYPCLMFALAHEDRMIHDLIAEPTWTRVDGHYAYRFVFGGLVWLYLVSGHGLPKFALGRHLTLDGRCEIRLQQLTEMKFLVDTVAKLHDLSRV
jgi:hypothetical protein